MHTAFQCNNMPLILVWMDSQFQSSLSGAFSWDRPKLFVPEVTLACTPPTFIISRDIKTLKIPKGIPEGLLYEAEV